MDTPTQSHEYHSLLNHSSCRKVAGFSCGQVPPVLLNNIRAKIGHNIKNILGKAGSPIMVLMSKSLPAQNSDYAFLNSPYKKTIIAAHAPPDEAYKWYKKGANLYFSFNGQTLTGVIGDVLDGLLKSSGQSADTSYVAVFVSPKGTLSEWHYDPVDNYTLQVSGEKQWTIAPAPQLVGEHGRSAVDMHFTAYTLRPGRLLFIPNGCWHKVYTVKDSVSLAFNLRE